MNNTSKKQYLPFKEMVDIAKIKGAAEERERIRAAVEARRKYCVAEEVYSGSYLEALMWVEKFLKDGDSP